MTDSPETTLLYNAAVEIADAAKVAAVANNPRMHPDAASLVWSVTYRAAREQLRSIYGKGFDAGERFAT
jgi:hypothetical protein